MPIGQSDLDPTLRHLDGKAFVFGGHVVGRAGFEHSGRRPAGAPAILVATGLSCSGGKIQYHTRRLIVAIGATAATAAWRFSALGVGSFLLEAVALHVTVLGIAVAHDRLLVPPIPGT